MTSHAFTERERYREEIKRHIAKMPTWFKELREMTWHEYVKLGKNVDYEDN